MTAPAAPATTPPATARKPRSSSAPVNPEFVAMRRIENALASLNGAGARQRVLSYFAERAAEEGSASVTKLMGTPDQRIDSVR